MRRYTVTIHRSIWDHDTRDLQFSFVGDLSPDGYLDFRILDQYILKTFGFVGWDLVR